MWCLSIVSMGIGAAIYLLWRANSLLVFAWASAVHLEEPLNRMRAQVAVRILPPTWFVFSLPQALWVFSGCLAIHSIWRQPDSHREQLWMLLVLSLAVGGEIGQACGVVPGTFDSLDLTLVLVLFGVAQLLVFRRRRITTLSAGGME
jgi:hypothetical protein